MRHFFDVDYVSYYISPCRFRIPLCHTVVPYSFRMSLFCAVYDSSCVLQFLIALATCLIALSHRGDAVIYKESGDDRILNQPITIDIPDKYLVILISSIRV
jgi:hypothetical protein